MRPSRGALWTLGLGAALIGAALVPLLATSGFAKDRGLWIGLELVIGWGFAGIGLFAWYRRPDNRVGPLMVGTAFAWYLSVFEHTDVPLFFCVGFLLSNLYVATAVHLVLGFPSGRLKTGLDRGLVAWAYVATTVLYVPLLLFANTHAFGGPENVFLVDSKPGFVEDWFDLMSAQGIVILLAVLARLVWRWRDASRPLRRAITPVFAAGGALVAILAALLAIVLIDDSKESLTELMFYSSLVAFGLVPYLFLAGLIRGQMLRGLGLGALVRRLGTGVEPGELRAALGHALGDPSVQLAYWLPDSEQHVDAEGRPVELPEPRSGRAVTTVDRDGRRIAAIVHDATLLDDPERVREAGAAAALALENKRLEAELRAKVEELRTSRSRLVEVGLRQRRRLERDLHDGAQQRLVSLALTLRLAQERLASSQEETDHLLSRSRGELDEALQELRELARGIHPAVLSDRGLGAAVEAIASRAPLPVEVGHMPAGRLPEQIEVAAYFVVSEALTNVVKYASASHAAVSVTQVNGHLTVEISDDGIGGADAEAGSGLRGLAARLEAIEGRLHVDSANGRGTTVRASIPVK